MSVPFKNVTVSVAPAVQNALSDSSLDNKTLNAAVTGVQGYLEILTPSEAYMTYNVILTSPALLQVEVSEEDNFPADAIVTVTAQAGVGKYLGRTFVVQGRPDTHDDGLMADHSTLLLNQEQFPL